jgi:hypothetical protein
MLHCTSNHNTFCCTLLLLQAVLAEVQRLLVVLAKERFSRLMLHWPYGGGSAEVGLIADES